MKTMFGASVIACRRKLRIFDHGGLVMIQSTGSWKVKKSTPAAFSHQRTSLLKGSMARKNAPEPRAGSSRTPDGLKCLTTRTARASGVTTRSWIGSFFFGARRRLGLAGGRLTGAKGNKGI